MQRSLIRVIDPTALHAVIGWDAALRAQHAGTYPWWQRGDIAGPAKLTDGTLFCCADTWCRNGGGLYLARNSLVWIDRLGSVYWISSGDGGAVGSAAIVGDAVGRWFWPQGAIPTDTDTAVVFGTMWSPGGGFGTMIGPYFAEVANLTSDTPTDPTATAIAGLSTTLRWGSPVLFEDSTVYMVGFNPSTFAQTLASHAYSTTASDYASGWSTQTLTMTSGPLAAPTLINWRHGWLASAKILSSAPGLGFDETPEIAAWWSEDPEGPYARLTNLHEDTTLVNGYSYAASVRVLPRVGLVGLWSRNTDEDMPGWNVDDYGPVISAVRVPSWAEIE